MLSSERKPFTAELQLMKLRERQGSTPALPHRHDPSLPDMCRSIEALRIEIATLRDEVRDRSLAWSPPREEEHPKTQPDVAVLKTELRALAFCIEQTKSEIAALRSDGDDVDHLNNVASELDAVVSSTEGATQQILGASERIETLAREMRLHVAESFASRILEDLIECTTTIFEACNFQDITGQRITKVVRTLQYIDGRINSMIEIWGTDAFRGALPKVSIRAAADESHLLNGPQLGNAGISQDDIDKLFA